MLIDSHSGILPPLSDDSNETGSFKISVGMK